MNALELKKFELDVKLKRLNLEKFRGFEDTVSLEFDERLTVLIGENGAGKTSLMDAIAGMLNYFPLQIIGEAFSPEDFFNRWDINYNYENSSNELAFICDFPFKEDIPKTEHIDGQEKPMLDENGAQVIEENWRKIEQYKSKISIDLMRNRKSATINFRLDEDLIDGNLDLSSSLVASIERWLKLSDNPSFYIDSQISLPIFIYHSIERFDNDEPEDKNIDMESDIFNIYRDSGLNKKKFSFKQLKSWLAYQKILELQGNEYDSHTVNEILQAAINTLNDEAMLYQKVYMEFISESRKWELVLEKAAKNEGKVDKLYEWQLSSGEKTIITLVVDIARQLTIANPKSKKPLEEGKGIVLIDEIDLHLHPKWQRKIVPKLMELFPKVQFVITTHSPLVLSDCKPSQIRILENGVITYPDYSQGHSIEYILSEIMDVNPKNQTIEDYVVLIRNGFHESPEGIVLKKIIDKLDPNSADYMRVSFALQRVKSLKK